MSKLIAALLLVSLVQICYAKHKKVQAPTGECHKYVSVGIATQAGMEEAAPSFVMKWWKKNAQKYPDICMGTGGPTDKPGNYLLVVSSSQESINGFTSTVRNYVSTSRFTYANNFGYASTGTITTSTPVRETAAFTDENSTIYTAVYDSHHSLIRQQSHLYSVRTGGDDYETLGHNVGFLIGAINARGRMLKHLLATFHRKNALSDIGRVTSFAADMVLSGDFALVRSRARVELTVPA